MRSAVPDGMEASRAIENAVTMPPRHRILFGKPLTKPAVSGSAPSTPRQVSDPSEALESTLERVPFRAAFLRAVSEMACSQDV